MWHCRSWIRHSECPTFWGAEDASTQMMCPIFTFEYKTAASFTVHVIDFRNGPLLPRPIRWGRRCRRPPWPGCRPACESVRRGRPAQRSDSAAPCWCPPSVSSSWPTEREQTGTLRTGTTWTPSAWWRKTSRDLSDIARTWRRVICSNVNTLSLKFPSVTHLSAESPESSAFDEASMGSSSTCRDLAGFGVPAWTTKKINK